MGLIYLRNCSNIRI